MTVMELKESRLNIFDDPEQMVKALADHIVETVKKASAERGKCTIALSGGSTPKALYELLATPDYSTKIDWAKVLFFLGDERCVPHDHPDSNFQMVNNALISKVPIPRENVFATEGQDKDPEAAAKKYEERLRQAFNAQNGAPSFDLILLGLGPDGHTASLFPDTAALKEKQRLFVANYIPKFQAWRLTLTYPVLNNAREASFLVSGSSKATIVKDIFESQGKKYPAQSVHPENGKLEWYMDKAAAAGLTGGSK